MVLYSLDCSAADTVMSAVTVARKQLLWQFTVELHFPISELTSEHRLPISLHSIHLSGRISKRLFRGKSCSVEEAFFFANASGMFHALIIHKNLAISRRSEDINKSRNPTSKQFIIVCFNPTMLSYRL